MVSLNYAYALVEFGAILRHTMLLVTTGNQASLGEVTVWSLILNLSFFPY